MSQTEKDVGRPSSLPDLPSVLHEVNQEVKGSNAEDAQTEGRPFYLKRSTLSSLSQPLLAHPQG